MRDHFPRPLVAIAALSVALLATACSSDSDIGKLHYDAAVNHPITVEPHTVALALPFATNANALAPHDQGLLLRFATQYLAAGHGAVSIAAQPTAAGQRQLQFFGRELTKLGVAPQRILVGTDAAVARDHVELRFTTYQAGAPHCGDWNDISSTGSNLPMENFGCATQHNLAVMVADPHDLIAPRKLGKADATERSQMVQKYEAGQITTSAQPPQSAAQIND